MDDLDAWVRRASAGDAAAFDVLVAGIQDMAVGYAYSLLGDFQLAQDAAQDAFLEAYLSLRTLRDPTAFPAWFRTLVFRRCRRTQRRKQVRTIPLDAIHTLADDAAQRAAETRWTSQQVRDAIRSLPQNERVVTTLFYIGEHPQAEIARFLGVRISTVKNRLHTGRRMLKVRMNDVKEHLQQQAPSADARFQRRAEISRAVEAGDAATVARLLAQEPALARTVVRLDAPESATLLHRAAWHGSAEHLAVAGLLLEHGADSNATGGMPNNEGGTPLTCAGWQGNEPMARLLLARGANPNAIDGRGYTAIDRAAGQNSGPVSPDGHRGVFTACVEHGGRFQIKHAILLGMLELVTELLDADPALLDRRDDGPRDWALNGAAPLHVAAGGGWPDGDWPRIVLIFDLLLERGAEIDATDTLGRTPLHQALERENAAAVRALGERGASIDIFAAAALPDAAEVERLLARDVALANARQSDGVAPLFYAAGLGSTETAALLLRSGAEPDTCAERFWMVSVPLHFAAMRGRAETCACLLDHGAVVDRPNRFGYTPLLLAARWGHTEPARLLLERGANVNAQDAAGMSALHWLRSVELVELLISYGADVNLRARPHTFALGRTPLHLAVLNGKEELARLLRRHGADENARDQNGQTPAELAPR
jgi:RNA polymerase sigma factor (sigma-70 family)